MKEKNELALNQHQQSSLVIRIIKSKTDVKLRDIDYNILNDVNYIDPVKSLILKLLVITSVRKENYPKGIEKDFLINMIKQKYGMFTIDEISHAFELAMTRELLPYMAKNDSVKHFGEFTLDYFGGVMNGYKNYKNKIMQEELNREKTIKEIELPKNYNFNWYKKILFDKYDQFKIDGIFNWNNHLSAFLFENLEKNRSNKNIYSRKKRY